MKRYSIVRFAAAGTFWLALMLTGFAVWQIAMADSKVTDKLYEWEKQQVDFSAIPDGSSVSKEKPPVKGELLGKLTIPKLAKELPIIEGTDKEQLERGVGHFIESALPGQKNNSVLSGHRDTVFRGLGSLEVGDKIIVETGSTPFIYEVKYRKTVKSTDMSVVAPGEEEILTLITCYPFDFIGSAPDRYVITAARIN